MPFKGELFDFQAEAVERMLDRRKVLVAFEMGLGKTVLSIATLETLLDEGKVEAGLIIVLASLKYQWMQSIEQFAPSATALVIDGTPKQREAQYLKAMEGETEYIILNYEQVVNDWDIVSQLPRDFIICDEVTYIKSFSSKRSKKIKRLRSKYKYGLSGQPLENKPEEVFSIMQWIDRGVLGRFDEFDRTFIARDHWGNVKRYRNLPLFHEELSDAMVRKKRTDPEVVDQLPQVTEQTRLIDFDRAGAKLYRFIVKELLADLTKMIEAGGSGKFDLWAHYAGEESGIENTLRGLVMSKMTCLRMLCDHPELLRVSAKYFDDEDTDLGSAYADYLQQKGLLERLTKAPKMKAAVELIEEILDANRENKIVLFSYFKPTLRLLQQELKFGSVQFHGDMNAKAKDKAKRRFQDDPGTRIFLSSDAGGYGVDLPQANYLLNFDLPGSAGKFDQRNARIVRLSSTFESVTVINLLMNGSIEERQYDSLVQKQRIASAIVDGKGYDRKGGLSLDPRTLTTFLRSSSV